MAASFPARHGCFRGSPLNGRNISRLGLSCLLAIMLAALFAGCAATQNPLENESNVLVRYREIPDEAIGGSVKELVLIHEDHSDFDALFADNKSRASVKRIPRDYFTSLVDLLAEDDFFVMAGDNYAAVGASLGSVVESDRTISVETPLTKWTVHKNPNFTLDDYTRFNSMFANILACSNAVPTFQVIDNEQGGDLFLEQAKRLRLERERAMRGIKKENEKE